jgi:prephenate dehydratase
MTKPQSIPHIAIQGFEGSFHQMAARQYFGSAVNVIPCASFREVIKLASDPKLSSGALMAIENSIAGSILPNYHLLQNAQLIITGEIFLTIRQQLMANPGVTLGDIREVHSHHMAIQQCLGFLDKFPKWKLVETEDTALSARHIHERRMKHAAAIAGKLAAELFQLDIIAPNIHTQKKNYTRFLVLKRSPEAAFVTDANKASVYFHTDHTRGSLCKVLQRIADGGINLSKLQSFPIAGAEWRYLFHADMEFDTRTQLDTVLDDMRSVTQTLRVLGIYKKGITF